MTKSQKTIKRTFDLIGAISGLLLGWPIILVCWSLARLDTGGSGFFTQTRVGQNGNLFKVVKLRTMRVEGGTMVTTKNDPRITPLGSKLRRYKLDELPQLWNVLKGDMSFVGPRPDVPGYLDKLEGDSLALLSLRPGITGPATLAYRNEEEILAEQADPQTYNDTVIWPDKVCINLKYLHNWSLKRDVGYIFQTLRGS